MPISKCSSAVSSAEGDLSWSGMEGLIVRSVLSVLCVLIEGVDLCKAVAFWTVRGSADRLLLVFDIARSRPIRSCRARGIRSE